MITAKDQASPAGQRPIVTPEMVEAGVRALYEFEGDVSKAALATEVYRAMCRARGNCDRR